MTAPLSLGAVQSITTSVPTLVVVGAVGISGTIACRLVKSADAEPYPFAFLAST